MKLSPKSEAIAFRIWQHCTPMGWNATMQEVAEALETTMPTVRAISAAKGWVRRFRATAKSESADTPLDLSHEFGID